MGNSDGEIITNVGDCALLTVSSLMCFFFNTQDGSYLSELLLEKGYEVSVKLPLQNPCCVSYTILMAGLIGLHPWYIFYYTVVIFFAVVHGSALIIPPFVCSVITTHIVRGRGLYHIGNNLVPSKVWTYHYF